MKKLLAFLLAALPSLMMAQEPVIVNVDTVGKLETKLELHRRFKVADLKITGHMNGMDLKLLNEEMLAEYEMVKG